MKWAKKPILLGKQSKIIPKKNINNSYLRPRWEKWLLSDFFSNGVEILTDKRVIEYSSASPIMRGRECRRTKSVVNWKQSRELSLIHRSNVDFRQITWKAKFSLCREGDSQLWPLNDSTVCFEQLKQNSNHSQSPRNLGQREPLLWSENHRDPYLKSPSFPYLSTHCRAVNSGNRMEGFNSCVSMHRCDFLAK